MSADYLNTDGAMTRMPPLQHARVEAQGADEGLRRLTTKVRSGLGVLFGRPVADAVFGDLEYAHERALDAFRLFEQAVAERDESISEREQAVDRARDSYLRTVVLVGDVVEEIHRRYRSRPLPGSFEALIEAAGQQWPYLYRVDDERHEHDFDAGGHCRNPACRAPGTPSEEMPF